VLSCALGVGCAASTKPVKFAGDAHGTPSIEVLPSLDVQDAELTAEMRMARMLSAESLQLSAPAVPANRAAESLTAWSNGELKTWLREKQKRAEAARQELDRAAAQNHRQRILAGALVGLIYEDVARTLLVVPAPAELDSEPEIRAAFQELMLKQAEPYLMHARLAYAACAGNAEGMSSMGHWSGFCSARGSELPQAEASGGDGVQVEVERTASR
jgi:hypothetical protein